MNNEGAQHPMDDGNDDEPQSETPKMNINFNSNDQKFNENINHETPQKEKNISTETKATTNKVNSDNEEQFKEVKYKQTNYYTRNFQFPYLSNNANFLLLDYLPQYYLFYFYVMLILFY